MTRINRRNNTFRFTPGNPFHGGASMGTSYSETIQWEEAVIVDVVVNDKHPEYDADGYNVGAIKFRFVASTILTLDTELDWAFPIDANVTDYPLINEVVLIISTLNRWYYATKINTTNRVTSQALFGLNDGPTSQQNDTQRQKDVDGINAGAGPIRQDVQAENDRLGNEFVDLDTVFRLRAQEGDIIREGRSGQSIRFGSDQKNGQSPTVLIRCGPDPAAIKSIPGSEFALISEDINNDLSSIWLVADSVVPITFATLDLDSHFKSMVERPVELSGNQIVVNSDRIIINAKRDRLLVSTFLGTSFSTRDDHTVDAEKNYRSFVGINREIESGEKHLITVGTDYLLTVGGDKTTEVQGATIHTTIGDHSIIADKIFIGTLNDESEPLVLGDQLRSFIDQFLNIFLNNAPAFVLPTIGIGPLSPGVVSQISALRAQFGTTSKGSSQTKGFLSENNFVTRE